MTNLTLFQQPCEFIAGAAKAEALPPATHPEIAFIGRSNAGKSSLINALVGRKSLARTSQQPGRTRQLNFFLLGDALMLVDMPGYGFANASKQQKAEWDDLITGYLYGRANVKRVCVLIDARRGVMESDEAFMDKLDAAAVSFQLVLTKTDAIEEGGADSVLQSLKETLESHVAAHPLAIATSALKKEGIEALREQLAPFAEKKMV